MANATVCLHYKEGDVSASFKLVLSPALQAKHATGKLLAWFARAERGTRPWRTDRLILVDLDGRCLDLDAPLATTLAAQTAGDDGFARLLVRPWLHERTAAALVAPKTADAWALFCPIEKLVLYDKSAATQADAPGLSADDVFYLRFLRKLRGSGAGLGKERQESFKKLMEGEAQRGDWKKEKRWARRGQIPRPGCRWVTCVDDVPCLVAEILGKEPVEDPSGAAPAGLRGGERVVARRYGVSKEHVLRWGERASGDAQLRSQSSTTATRFARQACFTAAGSASAAGAFAAKKPPAAFFPFESGLLAVPRSGSTVFFDRRLQRRRQKRPRSRASATATPRRPTQRPSSKSLCRALRSRFACTYLSPEVRPPPVLCARGERSCCFGVTSSRRFFFA